MSISNMFSAKFDNMLLIQLLKNINNVSKWVQGKRQVNIEYAGVLLCTALAKKYVILTFLMIYVIYIASFYMHPKPPPYAITYYRICHTWNVTPRLNPWLYTFIHNNLMKHI